MQGDLITGIDKRTTEKKIQWIEQNCYSKIITTDGKYQTTRYEHLKLNDTQKEILKSLFEKTYSCGVYPRQCGITFALIYYIVYQIFNSPKSLDIGISSCNLMESTRFMMELKEQVFAHNLNLSKHGWGYLIMKRNDKRFSVFIVNQPEDLRGKMLDLMVYDNAIEKEKQIQVMLSSCCPDCKVASFMTYNALPKITI